MTLYRKYRPQTLQDVIGQDAVTTILAQALATGRIAHAYLFAGSRGTGKTSVARILAKALNCQKRGDKDQAIPCNQCEFCQAINNGSFLDVVEIDAASNRRIDDIRALLEQIPTTPAQGQRKVYILDEAHMLTTEAFNALLKTLEEPPAHAVFILCTTESHKIPVTIASRCQRFVFQRAKTADIQQQLSMIAKAEKLDCDDDALALLAELADGGFRDAAMLLEQMTGAADSAAASNHKLTRQHIEQRLGLANQSLIQDMLTQTLHHQPAQAVGLVEQFLAQGGDSRYLISSLIDQSRLILFSKISPETAAQMADSDHVAWATKLAESSSTDQLVRLTKLLVGAQSARPAAHQALPLQLALLEFDAAPPQPSPSQPVVAPAATAVRPAKPTPPKPASVGNPAHVEPKPAATPSPEALAAPVEPPPVALPAEVPADLQDAWNKILESIRPKSRSVEALLRDCTPLSYDGTILMLQFWYAFHKKQLELDKNRRLVEEVASAVYGTPVKIRGQLGDKTARPKRPMTEADINNLAPVEESTDLVEAAAEIFGGEIID